MDAGRPAPGAAAGPPDAATGGMPLPGGGDCARVNQVLARIGDKWSVLLVMLLTERPHRFNELKRRVGGISQRMLTLTLKGLERDGLVTRTAFATVPPRVDYALTPLGRSLAGPVRALGAWAVAHAPAIEAARGRYDGAAGQLHSRHAELVSASIPPLGPAPGRTMDPEPSSG